MESGDGLHEGQRRLPSEKAAASRADAQKKSLRAAQQDSADIRQIEFSEKLKIDANKENQLDILAEANTIIQDLFKPLVKKR